MALITTEELQDYTGVYPNEDSAIPETYCEAATDIITNYLGYNPEAQNYTKYYDGNNESVIYTGIQPINALTKIEIDGEEQDISKFMAVGEEVFYKNSIKVFNSGKRNIAITFNAGFYVVPDLIKMTALRLAALLQTEGQNNIGITSKSWDGEGSRTFVNYANYDKYLLPISSYRIVR